MGRDALNHMIQLHAKEADASLQQMEHAVANDQAAELVRVAHRLKGGSLTLGFTRLGGLCRTIEDEADGYTSIERREAVDRVRKACSDIQSWQQGRLIDDSTTR